MLENFRANVLNLAIMVAMKVADLSRWSAHIHKTNATSEKKQVEQNSVTNFVYEEQQCGAKTGNRKDEFELELKLLMSRKLSLFANIIYILITSRESRIVYVHRNIVPPSKPRGSSLDQS